MPGIKGNVKVPDAQKKMKTYAYGEISKGTQRGIKVGAQKYSLRGRGETAGREVNVHKTGDYVGKEAAFYKSLAEVIASVHAETGAYPGRGEVTVGRNTQVIIDKMS
jgi:hypothetical protein